MNFTEKYPHTFEYEIKGYSCNGKYVYGLTGLVSFGVTEGEQITLMTDSIIEGKNLYFHVRTDEDTGKSLSSIYSKYGTVDFIDGAEEVEQDVFDHYLKLAESAPWLEALKTRVYEERFYFPEGVTSVRFVASAPGVDASIFYIGVDAPLSVQLPEDS